ncbi:hypothetical protein PAPYR_1642 [Paratrimastix pyriformis]|uniref:Uncharacterized protein n=1 Tax=Paratrimastix pyriformis TaxID=342808 RepID=A0ABQ8UW20_9EUKA|nr:hypothetical protein PAPYR_1642 [Paratrimastix pyriformis]
MGHKVASGIPTVFAADFATATEARHYNHQKSRWDALLPMVRNWAIRSSRSLWGASRMLCVHRVDNQPSGIDSTLCKALLKQLQ